MVILGLWLAAVIASSPHLFAFSTVSFIVLLASIGCPSRTLLVGLWAWLNFVLLYLLEASPEHSIFFSGLPKPAFWMLAGVGVAPILLWPVGFALTFRKWIGR
jgi:hypothetical protein